MAGALCRAGLGLGQVSVYWTPKGSQRPGVCQTTVPKLGATGQAHEPEPASG